MSFDLMGFGWVNLQNYDNNDFFQNDVFDFLHFISLIKRSIFELYLCDFLVVLAENIIFFKKIMFLVFSVNKLHV